MKLSTRSRYGVRLMFELAVNYNKGAMQLNDISSKEEISEKYLSQIVIQLRLSGLINSIRGSQGGYLLAKRPEEITIKDIVESLEGGLDIVDCVEDQTTCKRSTICVTQMVWKKLSATIKETLNSIKLSDLVEWDKSRKQELTYFI
ncbi:MAG: hypothetical protein A2Y34_07160 [Spirochaetes bacterium GWC1_27_15]|nr:MAG: hypothetical protein A2Z98_15870 [Spirochaetes bacterium GWB1_27_13]OHD26132.1 MAG: hypothetical protein A2Y34_07160 [Spirochaetes bacterium GWC1_27_15]